MKQASRTPQDDIQGKGGANNHIWLRNKEGLHEGDEARPIL